MRPRPRPERVRPRLRPMPNDFASRPHGPRGLNIHGILLLELPYFLLAKFENVGKCFTVQ